MTFVTKPLFSFLKSENIYKQTLFKLKKTFMKYIGYDNSHFSTHRYKTFKHTHTNTYTQYKKTHMQTNTLSHIQTQTNTHTLYLLLCKKTCPVNSCLCCYAKG